MPPTAVSPRWSGFRAHQLANSLGLQIQGAPHLVPSAGRAMSDLSPAIRSGFIDSNKMHGHVLLALSDAGVVEVEPEDGSGQG